MTQLNMLANRITIDRSRVNNIICSKKNSDGTTTYSTFNFSGGNHPAEYGFSDRFDNPNSRFTSDFELYPNIPMGFEIAPTSVNTSNTSQIIYIGTSNGRNGILINSDSWNGLTQLPNDLISGFVTGRERNLPYESIYPNIAVNSVNPM